MPFTKLSFDLNKLKKEYLSHQSVGRAVIATSKQKVTVRLRVSAGSNKLPSTGHFCTAAGQLSERWQSGNSKRALVSEKFDFRLSHIKIN